MSAPDLSPAFFDAWVAMARRLGADPLDLARVAYAETGLLQRATDPRSNAGGIYPFMPSTLRGLGWTGTPEEFRAQNPLEQLPWVERYLVRYAPYLRNDGLVYVATFTPAYLARAAAGGDGFAIASEGDPIYDSNTILDRDANGTITVGDLRRHLEIMDRGPRYETIASEIRARSGVRVTGTARSVAVPVAIATAALAAWYLYGTTDGARLRRRTASSLASYGVA